MSKRTIVVLVAAAAFAVAAASIAVASIPDGVGNIHACLKPGGDLRVIDTDSVGQTCKSNELALQWNVVPPAGPAGLPGQQGPAGVPGVKGSPGASGTNAVSYRLTKMTVQQQVNAQQLVGGFFTSLTCPQGMKALWGGWNYLAHQVGPPPPFGESYPLSDTSWGYAVEASNQSLNSSAIVMLSCAIVR